MTNQKNAIMAMAVLLAGLTLAGCAVQAPPDLMKASISGNLTAVQSILANNPKLINAENEDGWTSLHTSAYKGHKDVVEFLLVKGAKVTTREDNFRQTPLHDAAQYGH